MIRLKTFKSHELKKIQREVNAWIERQPKGTVIKYTESHVVLEANSYTYNTVLIWYLEPAGWELDMDEEIEPDTQG